MVVMVVLERVNLPRLLRWKVEWKAWQAETHRKCIPLGVTKINCTEAVFWSRMVLQQSNVRSYFPLQSFIINRVD